MLCILSSWLFVFSGCSSDTSDFDNRFSDLDFANASFIPENLRDTWYDVGGDDNKEKKISASVIQIDSDHRLKEVKMISMNKTKWALKAVLGDRSGDNDECKGTMEMASENEVVVSVDCQEYRIKHYSLNLKRKVEKDSSSKTKQRNRSKGKKTQKSSSGGSKDLR